MKKSMKQRNLTDFSDVEVGVARGKKKGGPIYIAPPPKIRVLSKNASEKRVEGEPKGAEKVDLERKPKTYFFVIFVQSEAQVNFLVPLGFKFVGNVAFFECKRSDDVCKNERGARMQKWVYFGFEGFPRIEGTECGLYHLTDEESEAIKAGRKWL